jgi:EmrB/QacA subfamily drug resistance transporter
MFGVVSLAFLMSSIDQTIVASALPTLQRELVTSLNWAGWTITIYSLGRVLVMPLAGRLSDLYNRRTIFVGAVVLFTLSSIGCGLSKNIYMLIAFRGIQAIGGGAFLPSATGLVTDHFGENRDRAIGLFTSVFPIGGMIGPILGGVIVTFWSWRGIFLVNVPIGLLLIGLALRYVPAERAERSADRQSRLDLPGMAALAMTILGVMLGITYLGEPGVSALSRGLLVPGIVAVVAVVFLARHIMRAPHPFITMDLLRGRGLGVMGFINFLYGGAAVGLATLAPVYAIQRYGISVLESGTLLTARAVGITLSAGAAAWALRRTGYRRPIAVGFVLTTVGLLLMAAPPMGVGPYPWLAVSAGFIGIGLGVANPASNNAALELAPGQAAALAGLRGMFRQAGAITAVSVTTAVITRTSVPGLAQAYVYAIFGLMLLAVVPLIVYIPEHRGTW